MPTRTKRPQHDQRSQHSGTERVVAATLEALLNAVDASDADTGTHVRRVATYALILADAAGLSLQQQHAIERVALFHDIGKLHEALFDIVHLGKRLSAADRRAIATHPQRGADVLAPLRGFYPELIDGVLSHHESWDGTGYPRGLKGRRIPLEARIVAIADTFDAITRHRPYKDGRSVEVARDAILDSRGKHFDPEWVDLFTFPPVFASITATERKIATWKGPPTERRTGTDDASVPDISFRWRPDKG